VGGIEENPKSEARNPKQIRITKIQNPQKSATGNKDLWQKFHNVDKGLMSVFDVFFAAKKEV